MGSILRWFKWAFKFWGEQSALAISKTKHRSSHRSCSVRKGILRYFAKFAVKHLILSLFFNEVAGLCHATLLKKETRAQGFSCESCKIYMNTFFTEYLRATASESKNSETSGETISETNSFSNYVFFIYFVFQRKNLLYYKT